MSAVEISERDLENLYAWRINLIEELGFRGIEAELLACNEDIEIHYLNHLVVELGYTPSQVLELIY